MHLMKQFSNDNNRNIIPITLPNLPTAKVTCVITAGDVIGLNESLNKLSIKVINTQKSLLLENSLANHADMLIHHIGNNETFLSDEQTFLLGVLEELEFNIRHISKAVNSPYPSDVYLNAARLGKYLICNVKTIAPEILFAAKAIDLEIISVKQGYTKCSVCIIKKNTIITEDIGIGKACTDKGIEVLIISKGSIKLTDHDYGFIGGCTGLIDKNKLAFYGDLKKHKDCREIEMFLAKHNIEPVSLIEDDLQDIGGIIPILQEN